MNKKPFACPFQDRQFQKSLCDFSLQKNAAFLEDMAFHDDFAYDDDEMEQMGVEFDHGDPGDMEMEEAEVATSPR